MDGGGDIMNRAARSGINDDGDANTDLVVRCSNVERNIFNEPHCKLSFDENACVALPVDGNGSVCFPLILLPVCWYFNILIFLFCSSNWLLVKA